MAARRTTPAPRTRDQEALLRAIIDNPEEDTPRLMYADLLDDLGGEAMRAGDARCLRAELDRDDFPVSARAALRGGRRGTDGEPGEVRRLHREHAGEIDLFGYHDFGELSAAV
jgi:uncharacterized protein (TIGR02996 family)